MLQGTSSLFVQIRWKFTLWADASRAFAVLKTGWHWGRRGWRRAPVGVSPGSHSQRTSHYCSALPFGHSQGEGWVPQSESWAPRDVEMKGQEPSEFGEKSELGRDSRGLVGRARGEEMNEHPKGSCHPLYSGKFPRSKLLISKYSLNCHRAWHILEINSTPMG